MSVALYTNYIRAIQYETTGAELWRIYQTATTEFPGLDKTFYRRCFDIFSTQLGLESGVFDEFVREAKQHGVVRQELHPPWRQRVPPQAAPRGPGSMFHPSSGKARASERHASTAEALSEAPTNSGGASDSFSSTRSH